MSNRRIAVGEHGAFSYARTPKGWVARTTYRGADGALRNRQASGRSKESAGQALHAVLTGPPKLAGEYVTGDSRIEQLATAWLTEIRMADEVGPETYDYYRRGVQTLICADDGIGNYRINELRPMTVKQFYQRILTTTDSDGQRRRTPSRPPWAHTVLSQMLRFAVEIGALDESPVRDINPPRRGKNQIHVLSPETFHDIRQAIAEYDDRPMPGPRRSHQLLDIFDVLVGTPVAAFHQPLGIESGRVALSSTGWRGALANPQQLKVAAKETGKAAAYGAGGVALGVGSIVVAKVAKDKDLSG